MRTQDRKSVVVPRDAFCKILDLRVDAPLWALDVLTLVDAKARAAMVIGEILYRDTNLILTDTSNEKRDGLD